MEYKDFIENTLKEVSVIARNSFGKVTGATKEGDNNQVLTETDLKIGQAIIKKIKDIFPEHNIIDEEAGIIDNKSDFTWTIDPIDGTSNFANGLPFYGIMVGLLEKGVPIVGGAALPSFNEIYIAEKGKGIFCNGKKLSVTREANLKNALVCYEIDGHKENPELTRKECKIMAEVILNIRNLRATNSIYDNIQLAKGAYGACLNQTSKIWDNVVYQIIVEEAGGIHTDFWGNKIDYSNPLEKAKDNFTFLAAPPVLHVKLLEIIKKTKL